MRLQPSVVGIGLGAGGIGLGAGAMYLLDPDTGKRRRALLRDQLIHLGHVTAEVAEKSGRDLRNRAVGLSRAAAHRVRHEPVADEVLSERIRAKMGHLSTHPSAIEVSCSDGCCTLSGQVLEREHHRLVSSVRHVQGVKEVVDQLEVHPVGTDVSSLQGEGRLPRRGLLRSSPPPAYGAIALVCGVSLLALGSVLVLRNRNRPGRGPRMSERRPRPIGRRTSETPTSTTGEPPPQAPEQSPRGPELGGPSMWA